MIFLKVSTKVQRKERKNLTSEEGRKCVHVSMYLTSFFIFFIFSNKRRGKWSSWTLLYFQMFEVEKCPRVFGSQSSWTGLKTRKRVETI